MKINNREVIILLIFDFLNFKKTGTVKMKNIIFIIICCLVFRKESSAQAVYMKGYVIQLTNDTLWGEIKKNTKRDYDNFVKVSYRKTAGNEIKTFGPKKIRGYWVDSLSFVSRMIDEEMVFVKRLSADTSTTVVYEAQMQYDQMGDIKVGTDYYVEKPSKEFTKVKSKKALKVIEEYKAKHKKIEADDLAKKD